MDIGYDEVDPEFDSTTERGRGDINDETEADIDHNQRSQEQAQRDYEERMDRISGMRENERSSAPTEFIEMIDNASGLSNRDVMEASPTPREKSRYLEWFNRARTYLSKKGAKFKDGMALAFFRMQGGYGRIPGEDAGEVSGVVVGDGESKGTGNINDGFETEEQLEQERNEVLERERVKEREENIDKAMENIKTKYPNMKGGKPPFTFRIDEFGRTMVKLPRSNAKEWDINEVSNKKNKVSSVIRNFLGKEVEEIIGEMEDIVNGKKKDKEKLTKTALDDNEDVETRAKAVKDAMQLDDEIERLEWEKEKLERKMSIKYRVKRIFKKYGFTVAAIVSSVGIIIGAVVSNLKSGLGKIARGMGNGLKSLGKKLGQVLPGIAGAIASFIFKTAGEVIGFLGKNAWLLIVAVVLYAVDQIKGKRR